MKKRKLSELYKIYQQYNIDLITSDFNSKKEYIEKTNEHKNITKQLKERFKKAIDYNEEEELNELVNIYNSFTFSYAKLTNKDKETLLNELKNRFYPREYNNAINTPIQVDNNEITRRIMAIREGDNGIITLKSNNYTIEIPTEAFSDIPNYDKVLSTFDAIERLNNTFTTNDIATALYKNINDGIIDKRFKPTEEERKKVNKFIYYGLTRNVFKKENGKTTNIYFIKLNLIDASLNDLINSDKNIIFQKLEDASLSTYKQYIGKIGTNNKKEKLLTFTDKDTKLKYNNSKTDYKDLYTLIETRIKYAKEDGKKLITIEASRIYKTANVLEKSREAQRKAINKAIDIVEDYKEKYNIIDVYPIKIGKAHATSEIAIKMENY